MEIRFLSAGSGSHRNLNGSPACLIDDKETTILMGCGFGTAHHLYTMKAPTPAEIAACCIPSFSLESAGDLLPFLIQRQEYLAADTNDDLPSTHPPIIVRGPDDLVGWTFERFHTISHDLLTHPYTLLEPHLGDDNTHRPVQVGNLAITTCGVSDLRYIVFSIIQPGTGASVVYMDFLPIRPTEHFWNICARPNLLIIPGPLDDLQNSCRLIEEVITRLKPTQTLLVGCKPENWSQAQPFFNVRKLCPQLAKTNHCYNVP